MRSVTTFFAATFGCLLLVVHVTAGAGESTQAIPRASMEEVRQVVIGELRVRAVGEDQFPSFEDIDLPLAVPMRSRSALRVASVCWDQDAQRARFQLECMHVGECLPFLAYVRTASRGNVPACRLKSSHTMRSNSQAGIHAGGRATAVLSRAGIRINAAVTCLQSGGPGDIIRVRGREGNIFRARIIGPSMVEANAE